MAGLRLHDRVEIPAAGGGAPTLGTFREAGRPQAVLLVHGILGHRRLPEIDLLADALAKARDVLTIDVRGHGEDALRFTWGREEWRQVGDAVGWLRGSATRVDVIGFSLM